MNDLNKLGVEAVKALKALNAAKAAKKSKTAKATELIEERNDTARPLLQQVHDAIAAGQSVNGQYTWDGWAKYAGWSKRALNYILNGRPKQKSGNSSSRKLLKELLDVINCAPDIHVIRVAAAMIAGEELGGYEPKTKVEVDGFEYETDAERTISSKQFTKLNETIHIRSSPRKALCQTRFINRKIKHAVYAKKGEEPTCSDCIAIRDKTFVSETLQEARERILAKKKTQPVDPKKDLLKRFRAAKRVAKFFTTMLGEARFYVDSHPEGMGKNYHEFLEAYPSADKYLRKPPTKDYTLPRTIEELEAEDKKAFEEFQKVLEEGKACGVLTDAPREKKKTVTVTINAGSVANPVHYWHSRYTTCGKPVAEHKGCLKRDWNLVTCEECWKSPHAPKKQLADETEGFALAAQIQKGVEEN